MTRRPLSAQTGRIEHGGDPKVARLLAQALAAATSGVSDRLTHGFHSYPARMHPAIAQSLLESFSANHLLDPFCGSGTTLVEALVAGRQSTGVDLNPLAIRIAEVKCQVRNRRARQRFERALRLVAARSEERVRARIDARAPLNRYQASWFSGHVLKELAGLREEIILIEDRDDRRALEVLLTAIVGKFSKRRADSVVEKVDKRIRKGLCTEFFVRKGLELIERWEELFVAMPLEATRDAALRPALVEGDSRELRRWLQDRPAVDLVITSPPYGGTYDYVHHHELRYPWLGLSSKAFADGEIGARRRQSEANATQRFEGELLQSLRSIASVLSDDAHALLLLGDAQFGGRRVDARDQIGRIASRAGLQLVAHAATERVDFSPGGPRDADEAPPRGASRGRRPQQRDDEQGEGRPQRAPRTPRREHLLALRPQAIRPQASGTRAGE